jgi:hypothetical protein
MQPDGVWVPLSMFIGLTVIFSLFIFFRYRSRQELQQTIRSAIDKGQELTPEIIERLGSPPVSPDRDLRRGLVAVGIAAGIALFGVVLGEEDAVRPLLGISMFPLATGIAFLSMYRFGTRS